MLMSRLARHLFILGTLTCSIAIIGCKGYCLSCNYEELPDTLQALVFLSNYDTLYKTKFVSGEFIRYGYSRRDFDSVNGIYLRYRSSKKTFLFKRNSQIDSFGSGDTVIASLLYENTETPIGAFVIPWKSIMYDVKPAESSITSIVWRQLDDSPSRFYVSIRAKDSSGKICAFYDKITSFEPVIFNSFNVDICDTATYARRNGDKFDSAQAVFGIRRQESLCCKNSTLIRKFNPNTNNMILQTDMHFDIINSFVTKSVKCHQ